jgi:hypothetical protein
MAAAAAYPQIPPYLRQLAVAASCTSKSNTMHTSGWGNMVVAYGDGVSYGGSAVAPPVCLWLQYGERRMLLPSSLRTKSAATFTQDHTQSHRLHREHSARQLLSTPNNSVSPSEHSPGPPFRDPGTHTPNLTPLKPMIYSGRSSCCVTFLSMESIAFEKITHACLTL